MVKDIVILLKFKVRGVVHSKKFSYTPQKFQGYFLGFINPYTLFGSEQPLGFSV